MVNLDETEQCLYSSDDFRLIPVKRYEVKEITFPDYIDIKKWATNVSYRVDIKYLEGRAYAAGLDRDKLTEMLTYEKANKLVSLSGIEQYSCFILLKVKNFRSSFRKSLRKQLETWLNGESQYSSPFSMKQWGCLTSNIPHWQMKRIDEGIYYSR